MATRHTYIVTHYTRHVYAVYADSTFDSLLASRLVKTGTRDFCVAFGAAMNAGADTDQAEEIAAPYKDFNVHGPGGLDTTAFPDRAAHAEAE